MKSITKLYAILVKSTGLGSDGWPDPRATCHMRFEAHYAFWALVRSILDPRGRFLDAGCPARDIYRSPDKLRGYEIEESLKRMKLVLGVPKLDFGTYFMLRRILSEALPKAMNEWHADVPVCAAVEFVRLETGQQPDPQYGSFVEREFPRKAFDDENWSWDDEIDLTLYGLPVEEVSSSEYRMSRWVWSQQRTFSDPAKFEKEFPGMAHRRMNAERVLKPVFEMDWIFDYYTIESAVASIRQLLKSQFAENRMAPQVPPAVEEAAPESASLASIDVD